MMSMCGHSALLKIQELEVDLGTCLRAPILATLRHVEELVCHGETGKGQASGAVCQSRGWEKAHFPALYLGSTS